MKQQVETNINLNFLKETYAKQSCFVKSVKD